ncbi:MAG: fluoride efflux transporter CrcB [Stenotrophomonas sp.]|uniref:fluoride efflux transporter CrcB n=1 Tax=Stenotrophomonas sp. TaxID=69392 RepID=UPI0028ACAD13|nr:fluoride efflux transporter CrcB [Stenotrophomonas sp.]
MWLSLLAIGMGAAVGAWLRYGLSLWLNPVHGSLPLGTLAANLLGGYVIGLALAFFASRPEIPPQWRLFLVTGLLGGLTTFSTFSAEVVDMLQRQQLGWGLLTIGLHLFGSLSMTAFGWWSWRVLRSLT